MTLLSRRSVLFAGSAAAAALAVPVTSARAATFGGNGRELTVGAGESVTLSQTVRLSRLTIAEGGSIAAAAGSSLSLTVNGVETGQKLAATGAAVTVVEPGSYRGDVVLDVATANDIAFGGLTFPFRQALYVGSGGVDRDRSVLSAVTGGKVTDTAARGVTLTSTGEAFNGVYVNGGSYEVSDARVDFDGNGRCDFVGYGAAFTATGSDARLVLDNVRIRNHGAVRTAVVADGGSHVLVKNSDIAVTNGTLPSDYQETVDTSLMESVPWMLGLSGNVRATNLLGTGTKATYVNSRVSSEGWGILSTDNGQNGTLTAINCVLRNTGDDGYGSYAIGNATEYFLGTRLEVASYACVNRGGAVHYGDSDRATVAKLNTDLAIGLTDRELDRLPVRSTVVNSRRFGFMWHGGGSVAITGATQVRTAEALFLDKGQAVQVTVDGSGGARLQADNGTLFQVMQDDDPGPQMVGGKLLDTGVYTEPTTAPTKDAAFDTTAVHASGDAVASFSDIRLDGDFYNGMRNGLNLALSFTRSRVTGTISATTTRHHVTSIDSTRYRQIGEITNTPSAAVNNGVIVELADGSEWTVTGTSHLTKLTLAADATVTGANGRAVTLTVDGRTAALTPGSSWSGALVLTLA